MSADYAELHCLTNYSFLRGAAHPEELVARAQALGYAALALTDECSVAGVVRAHVAARQAGLALLIGSEVRLVDGPRLVLLAGDRAGYGRLCTLITAGRRRSAKGEYQLGRADLADGLPGCLALLLPPSDPALLADDQLGWFAATFAGRGWLAVELLRDGRDARRLALLPEGAPPSTNTIQPACQAAAGLHDGTALIALSLLQTVTRAARLIASDRANCNDETRSLVATAMRLALMKYA